jgi:hypothetical protein
MKYLCVLILVFLGVYSYGQSADSLRAATVPANVDSSEIGQPTGDAVTKTIGPEGGTMISADGFMELHFPPGALSTPTSIGIQPIKNTSIMNFGKTYACTPDGIQFQKPVGLVLHYTDSMAKGISTPIAAIRWQDKSGRWTSVEKIKLDSTAHTLSGGIEHFSNYSASTSFKIVPDRCSIRTGKQQLFTLVISGVHPDGKKYGGRNGDREFWKTHSVQWKVNGRDGGESSSGYITPGAAPDNNIANYIAPSVLPPNPVEVIAKYVGYVPLVDGSYAENVVVVATVDLYDEFHYTFTGHNHLGHLFMIDSSSCDIQVFSSGDIDVANIQNYAPWSDWPATVGSCSYDYPDKNGWKGMVEIEGLASAFTKKPGADASSTAVGTKIQISLKPALGSSPPYTIRCKGSSTKVPLCPIPASPSEIRLEIQPNGNIWVGYGSVGGVNFYEDARGKDGFRISVSRLP